MAFTTTFQISKPDYKLLRYDTPTNENWDKMDAGLKDWASATEPGAAGNYDEIVLTEGVKWRDITNHVTKIRNASAAWDSILSSAAATQVNALGSTDLTTWCDLIDASDAADPKFCIPVKIHDTTYYIPCFIAI